jgi:hypothetical protein
LLLCCKALLLKQSSRTLAVRSQLIGLREGLRQPVSSSVPVVRIRNRIQHAKMRVFAGVHQPSHAARNEMLLLEHGKVHHY